MDLHRDWTEREALAGADALIRKFGSRDFLAPSISAFLLADPVRRLFGALPYWVWSGVDNRAEALAKAFEAGWKEMDGVPSNNAFHPAFLQPGLPHLLLNGTDEELGRRIVTSTIHFYYPYNRGQDDPDILDEAEDLLSVECSDFSLANAVMSAARFPFVSPTGHFFAPGRHCPQLTFRLPGTERPAPRDRYIVDGGYYDNNGAETALGLALATANTPLNGRKLRPIVVVISDDADLAPRDMSASISHCQHPGESASAPLPPEGTVLTRNGRMSDIQLLAPVLTSLHLRGAHARAAMIRLRRSLCEKPDKAEFIHIEMRKPDQLLNESAPLNWVLDQNSLNFMLSREPRSALNNSYNCSEIMALRSSLGLPADLHCPCPDAVVAAK